jgi:putative addiction module component (TIGR02574 family)
LTGDDPIVYRNNKKWDAPLAEELWDSIIDRQDEVELDLAQQQELDRRLTQYHQDSNAGSSWETVKQRLSVSQ